VCEIIHYESTNYEKYIHAQAPINNLDGPELVDASSADATKFMLGMAKKNEARRHKAQRLQTLQIFVAMGYQNLLRYSAAQ